MARTIQDLREERGESQHQLAEAIGVPVQHIDEWEQGVAEPTVSAFQALAAHFGVREDEINLRPGDDPSLAERLIGWS
jgi:transcriptional regulator with XRE-family HTH domain